MPRQNQGNTFVILRMYFHEASNITLNTKGHCPFSVVCLVCSDRRNTSVLTVTGRNLPFLRLAFAALVLSLDCGLVVMQTLMGNTAATH